MIKRTFTRDELEELGVPFEDTHVVHTEQSGENRWSTTHTCVFLVDREGPLWQVNYYLPATEMQECDLWSYRNLGAKSNDVEAVQVEPYEVTVIKYRPVADVAQTDPAQARLDERMSDVHELQQHIFDRQQ